MGNLFRRVLAFVLGMVFTLGAVVGSAVGGVFWAYKNLKPLAVVTEPDNGLNDLRDQSIEDLLRLLTNALENPDEYTFDRLQGEYGLDLEEILKGMGIEDVDTESENWKALLSISLFNAKDGIEPLLDSIKVRALYNFLPSLLDKELDAILSREAQEKLGDYSIMELLKSDETTGELGLFKALKTLKLGALLPEYFISVYDPVAHEYTYILNENSEKAQSLPVLEVFGNVELRLIANMLNDGDVMKELMNGSLSSITEMPIEDILGDILATVSPELAEQFGGYLKVLNGATLGDLFVPNSEGGYDFYYMGVLTELQLGFLLGLTDEDGDKVWVDKNGEAAPELMQVIANMDLGAIFESENPVQMVVDLIGDVNVGMILDMLGIKEGQIAVLDALRGLEIGKILAGQEGDFDVQKLIKALIANLNESFGDTTLGQLLGMESTGNALLDGLFELRIADLILEEYTLESIVEAFRNAIGDVSIGDIIGYEKDENGAWICDNEIIALLLDFSFNNIFDAIESDYSVDAIVGALLPETTLGDVIRAVLGFEYDETTGAYYKEVDGVRKEITPALSEALKLKIADVVEYIMDENSPVDIYDELLPVKVGDLVDFALIYLDKDVEEFKKELGKYIWNEEATSGTTELLNSSILLVVKDLLTGADKILEKDCDVYIDILNDAVNYIVSVAGLEEKITPEFVDEITDVLKENFDCTLGELKDADINWIKMGVGAAFIAVEYFYPEEDRSAVVNEVVVVLKEYYEEGAFDDVPDSILEIPVAGLIEDAMRIVEVAAPEQAELLGKIETILLDMFHGELGDPQLKGNTYVYDLIMHTKDLADHFLEEGKAKDVIDKAFVEIAEMYVNDDGSKIITKHIFDAIPEFKVAKAIESAFDVLEVIIPEELELLGKIESVLLDMFHGKLGDPQLKGNTLVADLVLDTKALVDHFLDDGRVKEIVDLIFDEIAEIYGDTITKHIFDAIPNFKLDDVVLSLADIAKEFAPEEIVVDVADLLTTVLDGTLGAPDYQKDALMQDVITAVQTVVDHFYSTNRVLNALYDELREHYWGVLLKDAGYFTKQTPVHTVIDIMERLAVIGWPSKSEIIADVAQTLRDMTRGTISEPALDGRTPVETLIEDARALSGYLKLEGLALDLVHAAFDQAIVLYDGKIAAQIFSAIPGFKVDDVISAGAEVARAAFDDEIVDLVRDTLQDALRGTLGDINLDGSIPVYDLVMDAKAIVNFFVSDNELINTAFDELANMYVDKDGNKIVAKYIFSSIPNFEIDVVIERLANLAKVLAPEQIIEDIKVTLQDMLRGTLGDINLDGRTPVETLIEDARTLSGHLKLEGFALDLVHAAFDQAIVLYDGKNAAQIFSAIPGFKVDDVISAGAEVARAAFDDEIVDLVRDTLQDALRGTLSDINLDGNASATELINDARDIVNYFIVSNTVNAAFDELAALYDGKKAAHMFSAISEFTFDQAIIAVGEVVAEAAIELALGVSPEMVRAIATTLEDMIRGKVFAPALDGLVEVTTLIADLRAVLDEIEFTNETVKNTLYDILAESEKHYEGVIAANIFSAILGFDVDEVIDSIEEVTNNIITDTTLTEVYRLARLALDGPLNDLTIHGIELYEELPTPIRLAVLGVATVLYFVANDTLVDIINKVAPDKIFGDFLTEKLGFTREGDKYTFNGKENALATAFLNTKVVDFVNDSFDYKGVFYDLLTAREVFGVADALRAKYYNDKVVAQVIAEIITLYGSTHITEMFAVTGDLSIDATTNSVARILTAAISDGQLDLGQDLVDSVEKLITDLFEGSFKEPGYGVDTLVTLIIDDIEALSYAVAAEIGADITNDTTYVLFDGLDELYQGVYLRDIAKATGEFDIDKEVIYFLANVARTFIITPVVDSVEKLLKDTFGGTLANPGYHYSQHVDVLLDDIQAVVNSFVTDTTVDTAFDQAEILFAGIALDEFTSKVGDVDFDETVNAIAKVVETLAIEGDIVEDVRTLVTDVLGGTLGHIGFHGDLETSKLVEDVRDIVEDYVTAGVVSAIFDQLVVLYGDTPINTFADSTLALSVDKVIESIVNIVEAIEGVPADVVGEVEKLLVDMLDGTLESIIVADNYRLADLIGTVYDAVDVAVGLDDNIDSVVEEIKELLNTIPVYVKSVGADIVELKLDDIVAAVADIVEIFLPDYATTIGHVEGILTAILDGTIKEPELLSVEGYKLSDLVKDIYDAINSVTALDAEIVVTEISELLDTVPVYVATVGEDIIEIELDSIVETAADIAGAYGEGYESVINAGEEIFTGLLDGAIKNPGLDETYKLSSLLGSVYDAVDGIDASGSGNTSRPVKPRARRNSTSSDIDAQIESAIEEILYLLDTVPVYVASIGTDIVELYLDDIVVTVANIVTIFAPDIEEVIKVVRDIAIEFVDGTIKEPVFAIDEDYKLSEFIDNVYGALDDALELDATIDDTVSAIVNLLDTVPVRLATIGEDIVELYLDDIVATVATIATIFAPEAEDVINEVEDLLTDLLDGTIKEPVIVDEQYELADLIDTVYGALDIILELDENIDNVVVEITELLSSVPVYVATVGEDIVKLELDAIVETVASIAKEFADDNTDATIAKAEEILTNVLGGSISEPVVSLDQYTIGGLVEDVHELVNTIVELDDNVNEAIAVVEELLADVHFDNLEEDLLALDSDEVVTAINDITDKFFEDETLDEIYRLAHIAVEGPLGEIVFNVEELWPELPEEVQTGVIIAGAATAVVLYFAANDTLVDVVEQLLPEAVLGDYLAEPLGYAEDYTFEGAENALASAIFNTKVVDIVNDDFDFEVAYYELLTVANVLGIADAVTTKYVGDEIVNTAIDGLIELYGDTHIVDEIVDNTLELYFDLVVDYVADVVLAIAPAQEPVVSDVVTLIKDAFGGQLKELGYHKDALVEVLVEDVYKVVENFYIDSAVVVAKDGIRELYAGVAVSAIADATLGLEIDAVVELVEKVVLEVAPEQEDLVVAIVDLITDIFGGTIGDPGYHYEVPVSDVIHSVHAIINQYYTQPVMDKAFEEVEALYAGVILDNIEEGTLAIKLDNLVASVAAIATVAAKDYELAIAEIEEMLIALLDGTIGEPVVVAEDYELADLINSVQEAINIVAPLEDSANETIDQLEELFATVPVRVAAIGSDIVKLELDAIVETVASIAKEFADSSAEDAIVKAEEILNRVLGGTIANPVVSVKAYAVGELVGDVHELVDLVVGLDDNVNEAIAVVEELLVDVYFENIVNDLLALDSDEVVTAINDITDKFFEDETLDEIYRLAHIAVEGPLGEIVFNVEELWPELPEEVQTAVIIAGAATAVVLYFAANDTLVGLVEQFLPEAVLGDYLAEPLGYAEDYTFEGAENALASAIFNTKVVDIVNDDFDFEAAYYELLTVANVLGIADAVTTKYVAGEIVNTAIDGLIELYGDTHIVDEIVDNTLELYFDDVVDYVADVLAVAIPEQADLVTDVATLVKDLFGIQLNKLGFHGSVEVATVVNDIKDVVANFTDDAVIITALEKVADLYTGVALRDIEAGTLALELKAIISNVADVLEVALPENTEVITKVEALLLDVFGGTVEQPGFHGDLTVTDLLADVKEIVLEYVEADSVAVVIIDEIAEIYGATRINELGTVEGNFTLDAVIAGVADILSAILVDNVATVEEIEELLVYVLEGTIATPGYNANMYVSEVVDAIHSAVVSAVEGDLSVINTVFDGLEALYKDVLVKDIAQGTLDLYVDLVIDYVADIVIAIAPEQEELVNAIVELLSDTFGGQIKAPGYHEEALVSDLVGDLKAVVANFTEDAVVLAVFDELITLYEGVMIKNIAEGTLAIGIDEVIASVAKVVTKATPDNADLVAEIEKVLSDMLRGTIGEPALDGSVKVADLVNDTKTIVNRYLDDVTVNAAFDEIAGIYGDEVAANIFTAIPEFGIDEVIASVAKVVTKATPDNADLVAEIEKVLSDMLRGTIGEPALDGSVKVADLVNDTKTIVNRYLDDVTVNTAFDEIAEIYGDEVAANIFTAIPEFEIDAVIAGVADVADTLLITEIVEAVEKLLVDTFDGTIAKPAYNEDLKVEDLVSNIQAVVANFTEDAIVMMAMDQVEKLYAGVLVKDIAEGTLGLYIDSAVNAVEKVVLVALPEQEDIVVAVADLITDLVGGTFGDPGYHNEALVSDVIHSVHAIINQYYTQPVMDKAFEEVEALYAGVIIDEIVDGTLAIEIDNLIGAIASVVTEATPENATMISETAELVKDVLGGTIGQIGYHGDLAVNDLVGDIRAIVDNYTEDQIILTVLDEIASLYGDSMIKAIPETSANLPVDSVVTSIANVAELFMDNKDLVNAIEDLLVGIMDGAISAPVLAEDYSAGAFIDDGQQILGSVLDLGQDINKALDEVEELLATVYLVSARDDINGLYLDDIVETIADIARIFLVENVETVNNTEALLKAMVDGTVGEPVFVTETYTAGALVGDLQAIANSIVDLGDKANGVIDVVEALVADVYLTDFVNDLLELDVDEVITAVNDITDIFFEDETVDEIYRLAHIAVDGPLGNITFNAEELWAELPESVQIGVIAAAATTVVVLYFAANDTLVGLVEQFLPEAVLGDYLAEPLGYAEDYTFEGAENALASAIFNTKVVDIANDDFDFEAAYYDLLTMANILGIGDAAQTKYIEAGKAHDIVSEAIDGLIKLYGDTHVIDEIVDNTLALKVDDVIEYAMNVLAVARPQNSAFIDDVEKLAQDVLGGSVSAPGVHTAITVVTVVNDVKAIVDHFYTHAAINQAVAEIAVLYGDTKVVDIVEATLEFDFDTLVDSIANVLVKALPEQEQLISDVATLVKDLLGVQLKNIGFHGGEQVATIVADVQAIVNNFTTNAIVHKAFDEVEGLYTGVVVRDIAEGTMALEFDNVVNAVANVAVVALPEQAQLISDVATLVTDVLGGKLELIGFHGDAAVSTIVEDVQAIVNNFTTDAIVNAVFAEVAEIYGTTQLNAIGTVEGNFTLDNVVAGLADILVVALPEHATSVMNAEDLLVYVLAGTIAKPGYNAGAYVSEVINATHNVVVGVIGSNEIVNVAFNGLEKLYEGVVLSNVKAGTLDLYLDQVIGYVADVAIAAVPNEKYDAVIADVEKLVKDVFGGQLKELGYHNDLLVADLVEDIYLVVENFYTNNVVITAKDKVKALYADATITSIVDATMNLSIDGIVTLVTDTLEVGLPAHADKVQAIEELVTYVVAGKVAECGIESNATVAQTLDLAVTAVNEFVTVGTEVNAVVDVVEGLFATVYLTDFVNDVLELDVDAVITAVNDITNVFFTHAITEEIYRLAHVALEGQLGNVQFSFEDLWAAMTKEEQIAAIAVGAVGAVALYFVANDTLVGLVEKFLPDAVLGDYLAEPLGYAEDYTFEGAENALASAIFNTKVVDIVNDDFDFEATYYDLLTMANILGIGDAAQAKYLANGIANVAIDGLIKIYGETHIVDEIVDNTLAIELDDIVEYVADVVTEATTVDAHTIINAVEKTIAMMVCGTIGEPALDGSKKVADLVMSAKAIVNIFVDSTTIDDAIFNEIAALYGETTANAIFTAILGFQVDAIIDAIANVLVVALPDNTSVITDSAALLRAILGGTVGAFGYHAHANVGELVSLTYAIIDEYTTEYPVVNSIFTELAGLFDEVTLTKFVEGTLAIEIKAVIAAVKNVLANYSGINEALARVYEILDVLVGGTIGNPEFNIKGTWNSLNKVEKVFFGLLAAEGAFAFYYFFNDKFVEIVAKQFGEDTTWGELVGDKIGYALVDGHYSREGNINSLMDTILSATLVETLTLGWDYEGILEPHVTLANLVTIVGSVQAGFEEVVPGTAELTKKSYEEWTMANSFSALMDVILNVSLKEIHEHRGHELGYLFSLVSELRLGDIAFGELVTHSELHKLGIHVTSSKGADGRWDFEGAYAKLLEVTMNYTLDDLVYDVYKGGATAIKTLIVDAICRLTVGDLLGETLVILENRSETFKYTVEYDQVNGKWIGTGSYAKILEALCNENLLDFAVGIKHHAKDYLIGDDMFGLIRVGELLGGENVYDEATDKWMANGAEVEFEDNIIGTIKKMIYAITIGEIARGEIDFTTLFGDIYLGDALNYTCNNSEYDGHIHTDACRWFKEQTVVVDGSVVEALAELDAISQQIAKLSIGSLLDGSLDILGTIKQLTLGELMGYAVVGTNYYEYLKDGGNFVVTMDGIYGIKVVDLASPVNNLTNAIASITIDDMLSGGGVDLLFNKFKALKIGDIFQYEKRADGYWYNSSDVKVTGIIAKLCDYTLDQVQNDFDGIIDDFTLGEVIVSTNGSKILALLEDVKIADLELAIEGMYIGEIMGYSYYLDGTTQVWYKDANENQICDAGEKTDDAIMEVIAGYKVSELSGGSFSSDLIDSISAKLTLKDLGITRSSSKIFQVFDTDEEFESLTIDTLPTALANKFNGDMKLSMLETIGMYTFNDGAKDMIVKLTGKAWENITVNDCFEAVFGLGANSPVSTLEKLGMYTFTAPQKAAIVALYNSTKAEGAPVRTWETLTVSEFLNTVMSQVPGAGSGA